MNGKTILFAWELGEGLGHLPALKAIAAAAKTEGARVVFALRDPVLTRAALAEVGAPVLPAPFWPTPLLPSSLSGTYADLLVANGFSSARNVTALIGAWDEVFDSTKPDLIVCEHAPGAAAAAFGRIPVAFVGNGFVVPPADATEFPPFEPGRGEPMRQGPVLTVMQEALAGLGRPAPKAITEPFRGVFRGVFSFPWLDTYRRVRREAVLGPIEPMPPLAPEPSKRRLFAYSAADAAMIEPLIQALMQFGPEASAYFRGSLGARAAVLKSRGITVHEQAPQLIEVLPEASVVFSHGGTGFTNAAFAAGRLHIVSPRHFEAMSTARALEETGAGLCLMPFDAAKFRAAVARANDDAAARAQARKAGEAAQAFLARAAPLETSMAALRQALA
jgi:hypothetical protein